MALKDVRVDFFKENDFYPGDIVEGNINFLVNSAKDLKEFRVTLQGIAETSWGVSDSKSDGSDTINYSSREVYIKKSLDILKSSASNFLVPGEHSYGFSFHLPNGIPSSMKGTYGSVTYVLEIKLKALWKFCFKHKVPIIVGCNTNESDFPELKYPHDFALIKNHSSCCNLGEVSVKVELPKRIYSRGELIKVNFILNNNSNVGVKKISIKLRKQIDYFSSFPRRDKITDSSTVKKVRSSAYGPNVSEKNYLSMKIPSDLESVDLRRCNIMNFDYLLMIKVVFKGTSKSLTETIPVMITSNKNNEYNAF